MTRRWAAPLAAAILLGAAAGCAGTPDGIDGDLTNGWSPMPAAQQFRPAAGVCHADIAQSGTMRQYDPIPCTGEHLAETAAVADLPDTKEPAAAKAYAECSRLTTAFLGADWRTAWVIMQPVLPGPDAWAGGARWVRCDVVETSPVDGGLIDRTGSLKGAFSTIRMGCANPRIEDDQVTEMHPVACTGRHKAEFAGLYESKRATPAKLTSAELQKGCGTAIATFARIPDDGDLQYRVGWLGFPPDDAAWKQGDRAVRCFLWLNGENMTGSYRNAGTAKLRIQYAN